LLFIAFFAIFEEMIKRLISIVFLLLYMAFLVLPTYPLLQYYLSSSHAGTGYCVNQKSISNSDNTKTGDMAYLSALLKSAGNKNAQGKKAQNPPPSNNEVNNLVYLVTGSLHMMWVSSGHPIRFAVYSESPLNRYLQVLLPPPNLFV
jgi:hypothetical protein